MNYYKVRMRFLAFGLLLCMLKVSFPLGEFFHNHYTGKELCTISTGEECHHKAHFNKVDTHHDCIFVQLHQYFTPSVFVYHLWEQSTNFICFFIEKGFSPTAFAIFLRGPPHQLVNTFIG